MGEAGGSVLSDSGQSVYSWRLFICCVCVCVAAVGLVRFELSAVRRCVAGVFRRVVLGGATGFVLARNSKRNMFEL